MADKEKAFNVLQDVFEKGTDFKLDGEEEINRCIDHIIRLLKDAYLLFEAGSYPSSAFMSIAAMEETGKSDISIFAKILKLDQKTRRDPLRDHKGKQIVSAMPSVGMGARLIEALGQERIDELYALTYSGGLKNLREDALYWDVKDGAAIFPEQRVDEVLARDLLLFSIETFDDRLVGLTNYSIEASYETDAMFKSVAKME